jgi:Mrp family chromosome partitioning ATPase
MKARLPAKAELGKVIALTSCCREAGVSTLIANLAVRAVDNHMGPVLIIDANMSAPKQHRLFRQKVKVGFVDVIIGSMAPAEAVVPTSVDSLDLIPLGQPSNLESGRIIPENCDEILNWARQNYATIFVDLPQIDEMRHGLMLARKADVTMIAIRSDAVRRSSAVQSVDRLIADGVTVTGTILTRQTVATPRFLRS